MLRVGNGLVSNLVFYGSVCSGGNCGQLWNDVGIFGCIRPAASICMLTHTSQHRLHCQHSLHNMFCNTD